MKIKWLLLFIIFLFIWVSPKSVKSIEVIELSSKGKKNLGNIIFGKKKKTDVKPFSLFKINDSRFCVIDQFSSRIVVYNSNWKSLKKIYKFGKTNFVSPVSGTSGLNGDFYISDSFLRKVVLFGPDLKFKKIIISDHKLRITGIIYFKEKIFAVDTGNHSILILNTNGEILNRFGSRGNGDGEFNFPTHISVDKNYLYINDALNFRIQIFDHNGNYISKFGQNGKHGGDFSKPKGIAVDSNLHIFITDVMFDNVQVFDLRGRFLSVFGGPGSEKGQFWMPSGIMIDMDNKIYVCDTYNNRIQVYRVVED